ncbi:MAG: alpha/beta hydrolase [Azospira oryzae]|jgi:predicted alpha/beta-hydrolase family hydrolase|nr:alpha/beta hydrolase [Cytophaga sp.]PZR40257.1 MAG: alpha/beta hydrolase [Azospira oryzae]
MNSTLRIFISEKLGEVSAEIIQPDHMMALLVLAHGAGAGMGHSFMVQLSQALAAGGIGTLRYNFPYMEKGKKRPDNGVIAEKTVQQVLAKAHSLFPLTPIIAGGKSFGGRMTTQYLSRNPDEFVKGIVLFGFPLHPAGEPATDRAEHLKTITHPMLFLQGTRDALAERSLIEKVTSPLRLATLMTLEGADHSFKSGKKNLLPDLALKATEWIADVVER